MHRMHDASKSSRRPTKSGSLVGENGLRHIGGTRSEVECKR